LAAALYPGLSPLIRSQIIEDVNGLSMHILEAGFERPHRPVILLIHGFPELAYSWREIMPALAQAGYRVIAPDMRGYGFTTGWDADYNGDISAFGYINLVQDLVSLVETLGLKEVACIVGHDFGSPVAAHCALIRPDLFRAVVLMSAPYEGPPEAAPAPTPSFDDLQTALAALIPPRKHYQGYYSDPEADGDMTGAPQGLHAFLRGYYHVKSADWAGNRPHPLAGRTAQALAVVLPDYYLMPLDATMAQIAAIHAPTPAEISVCAWLPDADLAVYADSFSRTGFQGGLNWYRCGTSGRNAADVRSFAGAAFDRPCLFIAGASDWGTYQSPGVFERMASVCGDFRGAMLIEGAGHWVQQEQPGAVIDRLQAFLATL